MKILCLGNELREDDAIALEIAGNINAVKAYTNPENFIKTGEEVVIVDAVDFKAMHGTVKEFKSDDFEELALSTTHNIDISVLSKLCKVKKVIGIQPKSTEYGTGLSPELRQKKDEIIKKVKMLLDN